MKFIIFSLLLLFVNCSNNSSQSIDQIDKPEVKSIDKCTINKKDILKYKIDEFLDGRHEDVKGVKTFQFTFITEDLSKEYLTEMSEKIAIHAALKQGFNYLMFRKVSSKFNTIYHIDDISTPSVGHYIYVMAEFSNSKDQLKEFANVGDFLSFIKYTEIFQTEQLCKKVRN